MGTLRYLVDLIDGLDDFTQVGMLDGVVREWLPPSLAVVDKNEEQEEEKIKNNP